MPNGGPLCVQWCLPDALTYSETEVETEFVEEEEDEEIEYI